MNADLALFSEELDTSLKRADRARKWCIMTVVAFVCLAAVLMLFSDFVPNTAAPGFVGGAILLMLFALIFTVVMNGWDSRIRYLHLRREVQNVTTILNRIESYSQENARELIERKTLAKLQEEKA